jgi:hypothetical protein
MRHKSIVYASRRLLVEAARGWNPRNHEAVDAMAEIRSAFLLPPFPRCRVHFAEGSVAGASFGSGRFTVQ